MTGSSGLFNVDVGSGTRHYQANGLNVFANKEYSCEVGPSVISSGKIKLHVSFIESGNFVDVGHFTVPVVPAAINAKELEGIGASGFIRAQNGVTQGTLEWFSSIATDISATISGNSPHYLKVSDAENVDGNAFNKLDKALNLADLSDFAQARANLGLQTLATKTFVAETDLATSLKNKIDQKADTSALGPLATKTEIQETDFASSLRLKLDGKLDSDKIDFSDCTSGQVIAFSSPLNKHICQNISVNIAEVSGLQYVLDTKADASAIEGRVKNEGDVESLQAGPESARPSAGQPGRVYISTDTRKIFYDLGPSWASIGISSAADLTGDISGNSQNVNGVVNVANGGTGRTSHTANSVLLGNGGSALNSVAPGSAGNLLTSNGSTWVSQAPTPPTVPSGTICGSRLISCNSSGGGSPQYDYNGSSSVPCNGTALIATGCSAGRATGVTCPTGYSAASAYILEDTIAERLVWHFMCRKN
nr:hypothetical protein BdHM001_35620 [Bdellovibrio sp. HM001]